MGHGTSFTIDIFLRSQHFRDKSDVEDKIEETKDYIGKLKEQINMFASSNPRDVIPTDWKDEPIRWIQNQVNELLESLEEQLFELHRLDLYLEYLNENNITEIKNEDI